jgi:hypothetical protein
MKNKNSLRHEKVFRNFIGIDVDGGPGRADGSKGV